MEWQKKGSVHRRLLKDCQRSTMKIMNHEGKMSMHAQAMMAHVHYVWGCLMGKAWSGRSIDSKGALLPKQVGLTMSVFGIEWSQEGILRKTNVGPMAGRVCFTQMDRRSEE